MTDIVALIDNGIDKKTIWAYDYSSGKYMFVGINDNNKYHLNLYNGKLLKNGKELAGIAEIIKTNPIYIDIFGLNKSL